MLVSESIYEPWPNVYHSKQRSPAIEIHLMSEKTVIAIPTAQALTILSSAAITLLKFVLPLCLIPLIIGTLYISIAHDTFLLYSGLIAAYIVPPAGKESIIPAAILLGRPWWEIVSVIIALDFAVALFMAWNFELALKIPGIGRILNAGMTTGQQYCTDRPWIRRLSTAGLLLFIYFPLQGSGALNGSILGRMLGMSPYRVLATITLGSALSSLTIALGVDVLVEVFHQDAGFGICLITLLAALALSAAAMWRLQKYKLRSRA
jgi:uncharacterized membrane protein